MARLKYILILGLGLAACAPSPLYVGKPRIGTGGEVPRDGRGEPIWSAMRAVPHEAAIPVMPPAPAPGIPVLPPA